MADHPNIWPFDHKLDRGALARVRPLPKPVKTDELSDAESLKVDAIFVFNDPRDWALDIQIITDLLLSRQGYLATKSARNGDASLPDHGWQSDGQPTLYFSHGDIFWATQYHLPRLAQGSFAACLSGLWSHITNGIPLRKRMLGKPHNDTYAYAERVLNAHREAMIAATASRSAAYGNGTVGKKVPPLKTVYMIGDNPESDIRGANEYRSPQGADWCSVLVRTGVWSPGPRKEEHLPRMTVDDVKAAVEWALEREGLQARI